MLNLSQVPKSLLLTSVVVASGLLLSISSPVYTSSDAETDTTISNQEARFHWLAQVSPTSAVNDTRPRTGRLFNNHRISQQPIDGGLALHAPASTSSSLAKSDEPIAQQKSYLNSGSTEHANEASNFASFGEMHPHLHSIPMVARQLNPPTDYLSQSSYHSSFTSPSQSTSADYNPYYHSSQAESTPKLSGYPTNGAGYSSDHRQSPIGHYEAYGWTPDAAGQSAGLMSSASHALSHWTGGFGISEILCTVVALAIGAIILGAPFFLIYLVLMGNFSGSGTISLANPTQTASPGASTTVNANGRRKRSIDDFRQTIIKNLAKDHKNSVHNLLARINFDQLSPLVDAHLLMDTYKRLVRSIEKFSKLRV